MHLPTRVRILILLVTGDPLIVCTVPSALLELNSDIRGEECSVLNVCYMSVYCALCVVTYLPCFVSRD